MNANKQDAGGLLPDELEAAIQDVADHANSDGDFVSNETERATENLRMKIRAYGELCRAAPAGSGEASQFLMEVACKAEALANRWRDDAKGFRERGMILAADDAEFYAEELEAILPREEGGAAGGIYGPLSGDKEASMRGYCMTQLAAVEDEYPDTGKFIRDWLTHVEKDRNRLFHALLRKLQQGADYVMVPREPSDAMLDAALTVSSFRHYTQRDAERERYAAMIAASQGQEGGANG